MMSNVVQIQAKFVTKQQKYAIPDFLYCLPETATRNELNRVVNSALKNTLDSEEGDIKFEFLVAGEMLRLNLRDHLDLREVSAEDFTEIEYFAKYPGPSTEDTIIHDDWVSAVKFADKLILTGCYDNSIHVWGVNGQHKLTVPGRKDFEDEGEGHAHPVKSVAWIDSGSPLRTFVSTSIDCTAKVWQWNQENNKASCISVCEDHKYTVNCVDVNVTDRKFATGGYDGLVIAYSSYLEESESGEQDRKRFKAAEQKIKVKKPLQMLRGHGDSVFGVQWVDENEIWSASVDHTLRLWDVELGGVKSLLTGSGAFFDLSYSPLSRLLLTASFDNHVRLWDPRSKEGSLVKSVFSTGNRLWVSAVKWSPLEDNKFVSGSCDSVARLWDIRCPKTPLYNLSEHEDKVLSVDWSSQNRIASGGADNQLKIHQMPPSEA